MLQFPVVFLGVLGKGEVGSLVVHKTWPGSYGLCSAIWANVCICV